MSPFDLNICTSERGIGIQLVVGAVRGFDRRAAIVSWNVKYWNDEAIIVGDAPSWSSLAGGKDALWQWFQRKSPYAAWE